MNGMKNAIADAIISVMRSSDNQIAIGNGKYADDLQPSVRTAADIELAT